MRTASEDIAMAVTDVNFSLLLTDVTLFLVEWHVRIILLVGAIQMFFVAVQENARVFGNRVACFIAGGGHLILTNGNLPHFSWVRLKLL